MDSQSAPLVSVITLNYNQAQVTKEFLDSFRAVSYPNYEILVCDMASKEDISSVINVAEYPRTRLLKNEENLGFAGGNNWGTSRLHSSIFIVKL